MAGTAVGFTGSIPEHYDTFAGPAIFDRCAEEFVRRLPALEGDVLEVACGTGLVTRRLRARLDPSRRLVATDLSADMVAYARRKLEAVDGIEWRDADAVALPFPDAAFGAVICQLGIMFVPDKAAAMREARRVLVPNGLFAFNVWDRIELVAHAQATSDAIAALLPGDPVVAFAKVPYSFHDEATIRDMLAASGFRDTRIERAEFAIESPTAKALATGVVRGTPRALLLQERGVSLDAAVDAVAAAMAAVGGDHPYRSLGRTLVVTARS